MNDILSDSPIVELLRVWNTLDHDERLVLLRIAFTRWHPVRVWIFRLPAPHIIGAR